MSKKLTQEEFIEKAKKVHGDKYDYSMSVYYSNQNINDKNIIKDKEILLKIIKNYAKK